MLAMAFGFIFFTADSANAQTWQKNRQARREYRSDVREARKDYRRRVNNGDYRKARREYREDIRDARKDYQTRHRSPRKSWLLRQSQSSSLSAAVQSLLS